MDEEILNKIKEILGEYYPNYCIIVLDQEGEVQSEYTTVYCFRSTDAVERSIIRF
jgi:hypothetical protein